MRRLYRQDGFIRSLACLGFLVFVVYAGIQIGKPYYQYFTFKSEVQEIVRLDLGSAEKARSRVYETAQEYGIPIEPGDIVATHRGNRFQVQTEWTVTVDFLGLYQHKLDFEVKVEE